MKTLPVLRLAALALVVGLPLSATTVLAQQGQEATAKQPQVERKERGALWNERSYKRFNAIVEMYAADKYGEASKALNAYMSSELNDFERANAEQMMGYILIAQGKTDQSIQHFENAIKVDALPNAAHFGMMKSLAQLYASREEWQKSINMMMEYLKFQPEPTPEDMIIIAQAYAQMERYDDALPWVQKAIAKAGPKAQESWYQLMLAIHFEKKNYRAAVDVLKTVVSRWPDKLKYWEMLSGAHQELEQDADAAAALMTAYHNGLLTDGTKLLNLARMNMYVELPYQAGRIIEKGIADKTIEANQKNLELLLQAWNGAREYDKAGAVIDRLAPMTGDGDLYIQKATVMMEQNEWDKVVEAADQAVEQGNLKNPGGAWLLKGIALMELGKLKDARAALKEAQRFDDKTRRQAREWEQFVEDRMQVVASR